jgi:thioredoxin 1
MKFQVLSIPTLLIFKGGQVVESIVGLAHKDVLKQAIDKHL